MKVQRKPHQILLIEHLFYPLIGFIFFVLGASYGPKVAALHTELQPEDIREITMAVGATILAMIAIFVLPYSCARLWKSSSIYLKGFWKGVSKSYAAVLFGVCLIYGALMLISLPGLFVAAWSI